MMKLSPLIKRLFSTNSHIKNLQTTAVSTEHGIKVNYPDLKLEHQILNPLETFISSLAACETATLRGILHMNHSKAKLGRIEWKRIQSKYDLSHWKTGGGKDNKIAEIFIEADIQTDMDALSFKELQEKTLNLCPIYQMITQSGVKVNSVWNQKKI